MTVKTVIKTLLITLLLFNIVSTKAQLVANFSASPVSGCAPIVVNFTDLSQGNPSQWKWYLDNTLFSLLQNPSKTFFTAGNFSVKLIILNAAGTADSLIKTQYINVYGTPAAAFTGTPTSGCYPLPVQFTDQSVAGSGNINSWQWDFGDGSPFSSLQNPLHTYISSGNKNVTLKISNNFGCLQVLTKPQYIQINTGVSANFSNSNQTYCNLPVLINFQNLSTGTGLLSYYWKFGDGDTSTLSNPAHNYLAAGSFVVTLITANPGGCTDSIKKTVTITLGSIQAAFSSADTICANKPLTFTNTSNPAPNNVLWDFGDFTSSTSLSPVKTYASAGNYQVKMVAHLGTCSDSAIKTITVIPIPNPLFSASPTQKCTPPLTVNFSNGTIGAFSYMWNFGDGSPVDNTQNPSHTYLAYGSFTVTLTITNTYGCVNTIVKPGFINIKPPAVTIDNLTDDECAPLQHRFSATVNSFDPVVTYLWDFGYGGFTSNLPNPTHTFPAGIYDISLTVTTAGGCTATTVFPGGIVSSTKPSANFIASPLLACAHSQIFFTDLSLGSATQWFWSFGDGNTSILKNPIHIYEDTGRFDVLLKIWNNGCMDSIQFDNYIYILPPVASFNSSHNCINPFERVFTDNSIGADEWHWNFGDGDTSNITSPTHIYSVPGFYSVTLRVVNHITGCDYTSTSLIHIIKEKVDFNASDTVICRRTSVLFNAIGNITSNVANYDWNFGDGHTGSGISPSNIYDLQGRYDVKLNITDTYGCKDSLLKTLYIRVDGPTSKFAPGAAGNCIISPVFFTDSSLNDGIHPIITWIWNYGDGKIDTLSAPPFQHTYSLPGNYNVSLKVIDTKGCSDSLLKISSLFISKPVAAFSTPDTLTCPFQTITFTNHSTGPGLTYFWDFGDNSPVSNALNPTHTYINDGAYTIKLKVIDQYGCTDSIVKPAFIIIVSPHANFTMSDSLSTCPPLIVTFTNTSLNAISVTWDFGDGTFTNSDNPAHYYTAPGIYNVKLTIIGPGGCSSFIIKTIVIRGPIGNFSYGPLIGCKPLQVNFVATTPDMVSFIWDFSDGVVTPTTGKLISHTYTIPGNYTPRMILVDSNGCQIPIIGPSPINIVGVIAKFGFISPVICDSGIVNFTDSSYGNDLISNYLWNFGDGGTSGLKNPGHYYAAPGIYIPKLNITTQAGCLDSFKIPVPVKIIASPQADFTATPNGCAPLNASFNGNLLVPDSSVIRWAWDFGNSNTSALQNPPAQNYFNPSIYNILLIATNSSGCKDTVRKTIEAFTVPTVNAGLDTTICKGLTTTLTASGAANYSWSPSSGLSCVNCASPIAKPDTLTDYMVTGTNLQGCTNKDTVTVKVIRPLKIINGPGGNICIGGSLRLFSSGANSYIWSPSTGLSSTSSAAPLAAPSASTTYRVIGTDKEGCFRDTGFVLVKVYPIPTVDAGLDKKINVGQSVDLIPAVSNDVTVALWTPAGSIIRNNFPSITVRPRETTEYTLEVRNPGGCRATDKVTVFVVCDGSNIFIPNTFSPNGDGINDRFFPRGTGLFSIKTLRIFSRWGEVMYEKNGFQPNDEISGWDGTFKGAKLTPDVYVYTIDIICDNSSILTLKGNIALIK